METQRLALEHEREKAARLEAERRLVELAAQQLVEQRRMQELQRQREEAEKVAVATVVIEASQLAEQRRQREEAERRAEEQRQQYIEQRAAVLTTVRAYFDHVNNRRADQAMRILEASNPKTRILIENTEWLRVQELILLDASPNRATVRVVFEGKARNAMPERYQGSIPLRWTSDGWRIMTMTNLVKQ